MENLDLKARLRELTGEIVTLIKDIDGGEYTCESLALASGKSSGRIRQLAKEIPGSRKTKNGWRFPHTATQFISAQPKPGPVKR